MLLPGMIAGSNTLNHGVLSNFAFAAICSIRRVDEDFEHNLDPSGKGSSIESTTMHNKNNMEGRTIARLRNAKTLQIDGLLILWDTGEVCPLWLDGCCSEVLINWLPGEEIFGFKLS